MHTYSGFTAKIVHIGIQTADITTVRFISYEKVIHMGWSLPETHERRASDADLGFKRFSYGSNKEQY